jgi:hypothetical protein
MAADLVRAGRAAELVARRTPAALEMGTGDDSPRRGSPVERDEHTLEELDLLALEGAARHQPIVLGAEKRANPIRRDVRDVHGHASIAI